MIKTILYTSNPDFVPINLDQVEQFAKETGKYYVCYANDGTQVGNLQQGAHVVTCKGNNVYVLRVANENVEHPYAKKCNITSILSVEYPFGKNQSENKVASTSVKGALARIKEMFMPSEAVDIRTTADGNICVKTAQGYVAIDKDNCLISYPEELTLDLPAFIISKPKDQLSIGDVIAQGKGYAKVTNIKGEKIIAISYNGSGKTIYTIKDFLFNKTMVRVVVSLVGNIKDKVNPALLLALANKDDKDSLLPLLMMSQNGSLDVNPMMLLLSKDNSSIKDILMMSALGGNSNPFGAISVENKE